MNDELDPITKTDLMIIELNMYAEELKDLAKELDKIEKDWRDFIERI